MSNNEITPIDPNKFLPTKGKEVNTDFNYARTNLLNIIETGIAGLEEYATVAQQSQNPRAYEVLATLLKTVADLNQQLLDISVKKKEIDKEEDAHNKKANGVTNNLYVGSTADLQKMLDEMKKKDE